MASVRVMGKFNITAPAPTSGGPKANKSEKTKKNLPGPTLESFQFTPTDGRVDKISF